MRKILLTLLTIWLFAPSASALTVTIQPGQLSGKVTNGETNLVVKGTMDARDFAFIADSLNSLVTLDLSGAAIAAYSTQDVLFLNIHDYEAGVVPATSLAGKQTLTTLKLPASATGIGTAAVAGCTNLSSLTLPTGLVTIGDMAFTACNKLTTLALPATVTSIGERAFAHCVALTGVSINGGNTAGALTVGDAAFLGCTKLATAALGNKLASIGNEAFVGTVIKQANLSATQLSHVGDWAWASTKLQSASLPGTVTGLGQGAFLYLTTLTSVAIPSTLNSIPDFLFTGDNALQVAETFIPEGVDSIGNYAFYNWNQVAVLTIPASVEYIGTQAMAGMTGLTTLNALPTAVPALGDDVWLGVNQPAVHLVVPNASFNAYKEAAQWKEFNVMVNGRKGDINNDGAVNATDLNMIINYLLGKNPQPFNFWAADIDDNNNVDGSDMNSIINIILGKASYAPALLNPNTGDVITAEPLAIKPGETRQLRLLLDNSMLYTALQADITLPTGLTMVSGSASATERTSAHTVVTSDDESNVRLLVYSATGNEIRNSDNHTIVTITVQADASLPVESFITIDGVVLATADGDTYLAEATESPVSNVTGVDDLTAATYRVYAAGSVLHIEAAEATTAQLVAVNGMTTPLQVEAGDNTYSDLNAGVYIVRIGGQSHKVLVR